MRVLFLKDVQGVALAGEVKEVKTGFARNYLLPQEFATLATPEDLKRVETIKKAAKELRVAEFKDLEAVASSIEGIEVTLKAKVSPSGEYYGTIGSSQIAEELSRVLGKEMERKIIDLEQPIKEPGSYEIPIRLNNEVKASIHLLAEVEE